MLSNYEIFYIIITFKMLKKNKINLNNLIKNV